jgi:hypothetical protein
VEADVVRPSDNLNSWLPGTERSKQISRAAKSSQMEGKEATVVRDLRAVDHLEGRAGGDPTKKPSWEGISDHWFLCRFAAVSCNDSLPE